MSDEKKKFDLKEFLKEFKDTITSDAKGVILDHEDDFKDLGYFRFMQLMQLVASDNQAELNTVVHHKLLMQLTDEELLNVKRGNLEIIEKLADIKVKRLRIVKDLMSKVGKKAAEMIVQKLLLMVLI